MKYGCKATTIPESVTSISGTAFQGCTDLTSINVMEGNSTYDSRENCNAIIETKTNTLFRGCEATTIPGTVTTIGGEAFLGCTGLTSITIPESITSIGDFAFFDCTSLEAITIPESVTLIGNFAFSGCTVLDSVIFPANLNASNAGLMIIKDGIRCCVLNGKEISVTSYIDKYTGNIIIPTTISAGNTFSVSSIGDYAFLGDTSLTSISIPENVSSIGLASFYGCTNLTSIICMATTPPTGVINSFSNPFSNYDANLYVPSEAIEAYKADEFWSQFKNIKPIPTTEEVELQKDEVVVEYEETEAVFSMPMNEDAKNYTLTISQNGVVFCTLTFNENGQLANIDFSTKAGAVQGFQFTVTGLSAATDYKYSFKALNEDKEVLKEYVGSFTTKNEDGTGGSAQGGSAQGEQGGQGSQGGEGGEQGGSTAVSEVSNATAVTIVNAQILVNGEAPAFVVTASGQKIANANLKVGVYFVVVDGKTVGVSVQ